MVEATATEWIKPIQRQNLSELAYTNLREALMEGRLKPGEDLPLRPISRSFGISATPMREALFRLVAEHALEIDGRGRISVPHLTRATLIEVRKVRGFLEGNAAREAALNASPEAVDALEAIHNKLSAAQDADDFPTAIGLNTKFHLKLCEIAGLPVTHEMVSNLWVRCGPLLSHLYDGGVPLNWDPHPHVRIVKAIRARDPDAAYEALNMDIEGGGAGLLAHVKD
ncbi:MULTISPECIES: GntR family transcriptional regulator [Brucella/Ochrobactrum group]|uniref:GntR family transcriptional regulator n=2 Tax=Ochrobactrum TaxID=528 RepID=A0A2P9HD86_9HYPH|nr:MULTISPECIES: GntR family transcriptional regulator [Brucella]MCI1002330.1 GntR family transcriptional regulator [Ochrobactrum sp. C6C9]RRD26249.1 GntR family transcriptional regulator [Brucellaceae bacterium VT-16-1752]WHT45120.1 GntR family transcriptional regulator [Ochrobactrum sp. SSR]NNU60101.1 GntR family transcriptional regulator [[Ochrobactrum] soli]WHS30536.1 GntR family transcriptional regulator [Brucella sp. NM4]